MTASTLGGIDKPGQSALLSNLGTFDGFGVQAGVLFGIEDVPLGEGVDPETLDADHALLVDVDTGAKIPCLVGYDGFAHTIAVVPEDVLLPKHRYAAGLMAGPKLTNGQTISSSSDFRAVKTGIYADAITALTAAGARRDQLLA